VTRIDLSDIQEAYERRFAEAALNRPTLRLWEPADRHRIGAAIYKVLGIEDDWIPSINVQTVSSQPIGGIDVECLRFTSWAHVVGAAHLYRPPFEGRLPAVLLCCGHGRGGKTHSAYHRLAWRLATAGATVIVPDVIGQGQRHHMGHADCVGPFACGTSLQGLIVLEARGWLRWLQQRGGVDAGRIAAVGNSGGGTATLFLAALESDLAALSCSGYPSSFEFVARKEKKHCDCNILPGIVSSLEMWQALGCFAPRPMFLFQGREDCLFPEDLFWATAARVAEVYRRDGAAGHLTARVFDGSHGWDAVRRGALVAFLKETLRLAGSDPGDPDQDELDEDHSCPITWPADTLTTDQLAAHLTGRTTAQPATLESLFPPCASPECMAHSLPRVSAGRLWAQFEAFLSCR